MRFYTKQHTYYCGIDPHARKMYLCILDKAGEVRVHQNIKTARDVFLGAIELFREDIVVAVECIRRRLTSPPKADKCLPGIRVQIFAFKKESPSSLAMHYT